MANRLPTHRELSRPKRKAPQDRKRDPFYDSRRWRRLRRLLLKKAPLCADPFDEHRADGVTVAARHIDHIQSVKDRPDLAFDTGNLQPLCISCHSRKTRADG